MVGSGSGSGTGTIFWPELDELKQVLDVTSDDWDGDLDDTRLTRLLAAAIAGVKADVGDWDELVDVPDANLAQAALRRAELLAQRPDSAANVQRDAVYTKLMLGHHHRWGTA